MKAGVALVYAGIGVVALGTAAICGSIMRADATLMRVNKPKLCAVSGQPPGVSAQASRKPPR